MDDFSTFDGASPAGPGTNPDGHTQGQAALLLTESLMHALVAKGMLSREDFIGIVEGAAEVEYEFVNSNGSYPPSLDGSLLYPLADAFKRELGR